MDSIKIIEKKMYDDILIIFSARKTEKGKFTFYKQAMDFPATVIFVNDYDTNWYLNGTPEFNDSMEFVNYLLGKIYKLKRKNSKVFTLGTSMGAYGALLYGSLLQADKVLAMGPESELCIPLGRSIESLNNVYKEGEHNISKLVYKNPRDVLIISGNNDIPDLYSASMFRDGNSEIEIKLINNYTHVVAKYIHEKVGLNNFIREYFFSSIDDSLKKFDIAQTLSPEDAKALKMFNEKLAINKKIFSSAKDNIIRIVHQNPKWSMPKYYLALIYDDEKNMSKSIEVLKETLNVQPNLGRARMKLAQLYYRSSNFDQAVEELLYLKSSNFTFAVGKLLLNIHKLKNQNSEYESLCLEMLNSLNLKENEKNYLKKEKE